MEKLLPVSVFVLVIALLSGFVLVLAFSLVFAGTSFGICICGFGVGFVIGLGIGRCINIVIGMRMVVLGLALSPHWVLAL